MNHYFPLRLIPDNTKIDFMRIRFFNMAVSFAILLLSIFFISTKGLNFGIDFKGGTIIEAKLNHQADITPLYKLLEELKLGEIHLQNIDYIFFHPSYFLLSSLLFTHHPLWAVINHSVCHISSIMAGLLLSGVTCCMVSFF